MNFFEDGTPRPVSVQPHLESPSDPTGGIDVTLVGGGREHWWQDPIDGFIRARQRDDAAARDAYSTPSQRLGHVPDGPAGSSAPNSSPSFADRFGNWTPSPGSAASPTPGTAASSARYLTGRVAGAPGASSFDTGAPAVPFVPPTNPFSPAPSLSFDDRFGNWVSPPAAGAPSGSYQLAPSQPQSGSSTQRDPRNVRVLSSPIFKPDGTTVADPPPRIPGQPQQQPGRPLGVVTGQPALPPSVYGLPDPAADSMNDWFSRWIKPLLQQ
jgi:hypothetical protein